MQVVIFGATGMVGQGVLRECLLDNGVQQVIVVGRNSVGQRHAKLTELIHENLFDLSSIDVQLTDLDACLFCLGVSAVGMKEAEYRRITYDLTLAVANALLPRNPQMTFIYVSGMSTDGSEHGRIMWARVKGRTENALLKLPFKAAYMFRPGVIQPLHGVRSKTGWYQTIYTLIAPLLTFARQRFPKYVTSTEQLGRAMIEVAQHGAAKRVLETIDINSI